MTEVKVYSLASEGSTKLSAHFKVKEFACNDGSDPVFIAPKLVEVLENIRTHFGKAVIINSGYRTVSYNKTVENSSKTSQHCMGLAADIKVSGVAPEQVAAYAETLLPSIGGIGRYKSFTHIDVRAAKSRWKG